MGDKGEDTGSAGAKPVQQKQVNVSAIPKGNIRNDELKNRHKQMKSSLRVSCGILRDHRLDFEIRKRDRNNERYLSSFRYTKRGGK